MSESKVKELKKDMPVDAIISDLEEQLSVCSSTVVQAKESIAERLSSAARNLVSAPSLNWPMDGFEEQRYTEEAFQTFEKLSQSNEVLNNLVYPDLYEVPFLETLQQKMSEESGQSKEPIEPEYKAGKNWQSSGGDDIVCEVCNDGDYEDKNMIVVCSACDLSVHQKCYGIAHIPSEDWICDGCAAFGASRKKLRCALCPVAGGAMKPTTISVRDPFFSSKNPLHCDAGEDQSAKEEPRPSVLWVHLSCAHWIPELELWSKNFAKCIAGLNLIDKDRFKLTCSLCKLKATGCCIQCSKGKCPVSFHVECARVSGTYLDFAAQSEEASTAFCDKHRPLHLKKELEKSRKRSAEDILKFCKVVDKCLGRLSAADQGEGRGSARRHRVGNKLFNKAEKKRLVARMRFICQKYGLLFVTLAQQPNDEYKVGGKSMKLEYGDTLSKRGFPWNEVKVDGKFTALNCYNKYVSLVPDEETYKLKILSMGKERVEREKRLKLKMLKEEQKRNAVDMNKYCYCRKTVQEVASPMIGTLYLATIECSGGDECPGNNWYHLCCIGKSYTNEELSLITFYCEPCKQRLNII